MFDRLTTDWQGKTVILIGGGPSLRTFNFLRLKRQRMNGVIVVAINDAVKRAPFSNVVISIDSLWLGRRFHVLRAFRGEKIAVVDGSRTIFRPGIRYFVRSQEARLSEDMGVICAGENSGFAALGMSLMRGASKIFMLGFDMNGPGHFHAGYEWKCPHGVADYPRWVGYFPVLAEAAAKQGTSIINCNPDSAVRCFPFGSIDA